MKKRKIKIDTGTFPDRIGKLLVDANVYDSSCHSDAVVYYADTGYYIKTDAPNRLANEAELGRLFHSKGYGVEVVDYISADRDYLVTRSAAGEDLTHCIDHPEKLCGILAGSLRRLHEESIDGVPVSARFQRYMDMANGGFSDGNFDESVLMDRFRIHSREEAWNIMQANRHLLAADTIIHGDACLPNVIQANGRFSAFIDFNLAGAGDRHIDLYWAIWSLQFNLKTDAYTDPFLNMYGRDGFNEDMLRVVAAYELFS